MNRHAHGSRPAKLVYNLRFFISAAHPAAWLAHPERVTPRWSR